MAFFVQSLAVQTHIHPQIPAIAKTSAQGTSAPTPAQNQDPIDQCRLCQELVHAGTFVAPSAVTTVAILILVAAVVAASVAPADHSVTAFAWRSRAPPRR